MSTFAQRAGGQGLFRFVTAGSVDDGKSTLIGRLLHDAGAVPLDQLAALDRLARRRGESAIDLSLLTDGLAAEREQGVTIDVAYRYFATARRKFVIADTPGHEQYVRNMVTGASTADAAVILVDARKGATVQTRRHFYLAHLLGIPHLIVAVNKMDLVDFDRQAFLALGREIAAAADALGAPRPVLVPVSAKAGDNVVRRSPRLAWHDGPPLLSLLEGLPHGQIAAHAPFRFPVQIVQRAESADGRPVRRYLGRIESGAVAPGDRIAVLPAGAAATVRSVATFEGAVERAAAPLSVAVEIDDDLDIARGDMLAHFQERPAVARAFAAMLCWLGEEPFDARSRLLLRHGTRTVGARIDAIAHRVDMASLAAESSPRSLARNDIARVRVATQAPIAFDAYAVSRATGACILIDPNSNATVAALMIQD